MENDNIMARIWKALHVVYPEGHQGSLRHKAYKAYSEYLYTPQIRDKDIQLRCACCTLPDQGVSRVLCELETTDRDSLNDAVRPLKSDGVVGVYLTNGKRTTPDRFQFIRCSVSIVYVDFIM